MRNLLVLAFLVGCGSSGGAGTSMDLAMSQSADLAPVTWTSFAQGFFATYCNSCHNPSGQASQQDFSQYDQVMANASAIRCGVAPTKQSGCGITPAPKQFPIGNGPFPSDDARSQIVAWIDAGLPR